MKKLATIFTIALGLLATTSCDSYLDINQDPNSPAEANMSTDIMFPAAEMNLASTYGDFYRITGGYFAQYYSQAFGTSNYLDYSRFTMSATRSSTDYTQLNQRALKNLKTVAELAEQSEEWGTFLAAKTLKAFIYQMLVDAYGEVPYSEALDAGISTPSTTLARTSMPACWPNLTTLSRKSAKARRWLPTSCCPARLLPTGSSWLTP